MFLFHYPLQDLAQLLKSLGAFLGVVPIIFGAGRGEVDPILRTIRLPVCIPFATRPRFLQRASNVMFKRRVNKAFFHRSAVPFSPCLSSVLQVLLRSILFFCWRTWILTPRYRVSWCSCLLGENVSRCSIPISPGLACSFRSSHCHRHKTAAVLTTIITRRPSCFSYCH